MHPMHAVRATPVPLRRGHIAARAVTITLCALLATALGPAAVRAAGPMGVEVAGVQSGPDGQVVFVCGLTVGAAADACALPVAPGAAAEVAGVQTAVNDAPLAPSVTLGAPHVSMSSGQWSFTETLAVSGHELATYAAGPPIPASGWPSFGQLVPGNHDGSEQFVTIDIPVSQAATVKVALYRPAGAAVLGQGGLAPVDALPAATSRQAPDGQIAVIAVPFGADTYVYVNTPAVLSATQAEPAP